MKSYLNSILLPSPSFVIMLKYIKFTGRGKLRSVLLGTKKGSVAVVMGKLMRSVIIVHTRTASKDKL
jgi:hypothetical protein